MYGRIKSFVWIITVLFIFSKLLQLIDGSNILASPLPSPMKSPARTPRGPCCVALYDFVPENPGELGFKVCMYLFQISV